MHGGSFTEMAGVSLPRGLAENWAAATLGELAGEPLIVAITAGGCLVVSSIEDEDFRGDIFGSLPAEVRQPITSLQLAETALRSEAFHLVVTTMNRGILWVTVDLGNARVTTEVLPSPRVPLTGYRVVPAGVQVSEWTEKRRGPAVVATLSDNGVCGWELAGDGGSWRETAEWSLVDWLLPLAVTRQATPITWMAMGEGRLVVASKDRVVGVALRRGGEKRGDDDDHDDGDDHDHHEDGKIDAAEKPEGETTSRATPSTVVSMASCDSKTLADRKKELATFLKGRREGMKRLEM